MNKFMKIHNGGLDNISLEDLKTFEKNPGHQGYEEWLIKQEHEAVVLYIENIFITYLKNQFCR